MHDFVIDAFSPREVTLGRAYLTGNANLEPAAPTRGGYSEIAFIDPSCPDVENLVSHLRSDVTGVLLDKRRPASQQISRALRDCRGLRAIHLIAHGARGKIAFGSGDWTIDSLAREPELASIGRALGADGQLQLWSCETAAGVEGETFVTALAAATNANVVATSQRVGAAELGGSWTLTNDHLRARSPLTAAGMATYRGILAAGPAHIVVVNLENQDFSNVIGNPLAPFLNSLVSQGMLLTSDTAVGHPSQLNYLALFAGSTEGVTTDTPPSGLTGATLASALAAKGLTFTGYAEHGADVGHTPWLDFTNSSADGQDFSNFPTTASGFAGLSTVSFITPNDADNMTPTGEGGGGVAAGDIWLQANLSAYANWATNDDSLLIITFDENDSNTLPNQVATIIVGAGVPAGVTNSQATNQYSLLATIESLYGLTPVGESATAPVLNFFSATPNTSTSTFTNLPPGISDPTNYPPQNALAVGPNYVVTGESSKLQFTNLGTNQTTTVSLYDLFAGEQNHSTANSLLDARAVYDSASGLYVLSAVEYDTNGQINIDIATTTDPSGAWNVATILTGSAATDMPGLSVSNGNVYITPQVSGGTDTYIVPLSDIVNGAELQAGSNGVEESSNRDNGNFQIVSGTSGFSYLLAAYTNGAHTDLSYQTVNAAGQFTATQTIALSNPDGLSNSADFVADQLGSTEQLDAGNRNIASLAYANENGDDYVYGVSEVKPTGATQPEFEWFELDVTHATDGTTAPVYVQGGDISPASLGFSSDVAIFNPSIAVNAAGDVIINFTASGTSMDPAAYYIVAGANQDFGAATLYQSSNAPLVEPPNTAGLARWGAYSSATADPNNPNGFWISNEYVVSGLANNFSEPAWWSTVTSNVVVSEQVCFAEGTRIATEFGWKAVERVAVGDVVRTSSGQLRSVKWVGHRTLDCAKAAHPSIVMPVCVAAHAFGPEQPMRDLYLSPAHAICVDMQGEILAPVSSLLNGATIRQVYVEKVTYWHVELESHDILLAENLPAESYLEFNNRGFFSESAVVELDARPDAPIRTTADFCRPFHVDGPLVEAARKQLRARAQEMGWRMETRVDLHLLAEGIRIEPVMRGKVATFPLPRGDVWLVCETSRPCDVGVNADQRALGVAISRLSYGDGVSPMQDIDLADARLNVGLYPLEKSGIRWTSGRTLLPAKVFADAAEANVLRIELVGAPLPRWIAPELKDPTAPAFVTPTAATA